MAVTSDSDPDPELSRPKKTRLGVILKAVFKVTFGLYTLYKYAARLVDFVKELMD